MQSIFQGTGLDIYIHWLILGLGVGILVSALAVLFSCRSVAAVFHLLRPGTSWRDRLYRGFFQYHAYYWAAFGLVLILHLMVTTVHVGFPAAGEDFHQAHVLAFITSLTNIVLLLVVLTSCRTVNGLITLVFSRNPQDSALFRGFYRFHAVYWWLLGGSLVTHIVAGLVHAINT